MKNKDNIQPPQRFNPPQLIPDQEGTLCYVYDSAAYGNKNKRNALRGANSETKITPVAPVKAVKPLTPVKRGDSWAYLPQ